MKRRRTYPRRQIIWPTPPLSEKCQRALARVPASVEELRQQVFVDPMNRRVK